MSYGKKKILIIFCVLSMVITIAFIRYAGLKTIDVENTILDQGYNAKAFLVKDEEIIYLMNSNSIDYTIQEGTKISLNTIIGKSNHLNYNSQDALDLEIIDWKIKNGMVQDSNLFNKDLEKIKKEIQGIENELNGQNDPQEVARLNKAIKDLEHKKSIIEGSFRFAFADQDSLNTLKNEIENREGHIQGQISPKKLGVKKPGILYFKKDGLENVLHKDLLGSITPAYYEEIEKYISNNQEALENNQASILKFIDESNMYLIAKVPADSFLDEEENLEKTLNPLNNQWKEEGYKNLFSYIENRKDIVMLFPSIQMEYQDFLIDGFIIDIKVDQKRNEKVLTIKVDSNNHKLAGGRILDDVYLFDNTFTGYILPKEAIIKKNDVDGVIMLGKANQELFIEVKINKVLEKHIVLNPEENLQLKPGSKILAKP